MDEDVLVDNSLAVEYSYMSNPDGTIRWIYPKQLKKPSFLNFYSTASLRAKVLSAIIKLAFFTKQSHRVKSGDLNLDIAENSRLGKVLNEYAHTGFSIFTGTAGENRKAVIEIHDEKQIFVFVKIALTEAAKALVKNEAMCLEYLNTFEFNTMVVPKLLSNNEIDTIGLSNIKPKSFHQDSSLTNEHVHALSELYGTSNRQMKWTDLTTLNESKHKIKNLLNDFEEVNDLGMNRVQDLANKILLLINMIEEKDDELSVAMSHGDFTPWNMYSSNNVLHLFDWELSQNNMPIMFDLFHFILQSETMINKSSYQKTKQKIIQVLRSTNIKSLIRTYSIDINKHYIFYLIYNISYYLSKYIYQKDLHIQATWLLEVWEDAIEDILLKKGRLFND